MPVTATRPPNDIRQYDDLVEAWWDPRGAFAMLHWIAAARAELIPLAPRQGAVLVDLACGGGLLAPYAAARGYHHIGIDLTASALQRAAAWGVAPVRADVHALPLPAGCADVVTAGEILEHVGEPAAVVAEAARVLRPGGRLVIDTIAATRLARFLVVTVAERVPGMAPPGIHDPALFVDRKALVAACREHGIELRLRGIRPAVGSVLAWKAGRRPAARLVPTRSTAVLFQGWGTAPERSAA
ncbi:MAG TPA: methyltransferase domain-containing protein [Candidatus Nanopelagicales bacterium]|nr:methyltransferase domain-containing protein [Candidatus Nanopelagicales bacterium]